MDFESDTRPLHPPWKGSDMPAETDRLISTRPNAVASESVNTIEMLDSTLKGNYGVNLTFALCTIAGLLCSLNLLDSGIIYHI